MRTVVIHRLKFDAICVSVLAVGALMTAQAQSTGSIEGVVLGDGGKPIAGARVYAATKTTSQATKAPPTIATRFGNAVNAAADGTFSIPGLPAGPYILCAQTTTAGWLDPCQWASLVPLAVLPAGQNLTGQKVVLTKGAVIQIRINDPHKLLPTLPTAVAHDVEVLALASNKSYYHARIASADGNGRTHQLTVPFDLAHTLIVRSQQFALSDSQGNAVASNGHSESVTASSGKNAPQFNFTVTAKNN